MGIFDKMKKAKDEKNIQPKEYKKNLTTGSGMWALWDYKTYEDVDEYDKWEPLFCEDEDLKKQIERNSFVPVYIFEDGCRSFTLKIDKELSEREQKYICVRSEEYIFYSNGKAVLSGIDCIDTNVKSEEAIIFDLPKGYYSVSVFLLSWDEEPGAYLDNGQISPNALSDFIVLVKSDADENKTYRKKINTFSEDD